MATDFGSYSSSVDVLGSSAEPSFCGEYVVVDKSKLEQEDSLERSEERFNAVNALESETLTTTEQKLVSRLKELGEENEGLKTVLLENNTVLQNCFKELQHWQDEQKENHKMLIEKHRQAKMVITTLKDKNERLKAELKESKEKNALNLAEPCKADSSTVDSTLQERLQKLQDENKMLLQEKALFEKNFGIVQSQIHEIMSTSEPESQLSLTDTESLMKIVDTLMSSLNLCEEKDGSCPSPEDHSPQVDINMNYEALKTNFEEIKLQYERIQSEQEQVKQAYVNLQNEKEHEKLRTESLETDFFKMKAENETLKTEKEQIQQSFQKFEVERENDKQKLQEEINALNRHLQECYDRRDRENTGFREEISRKDEQITSYKKTNATLLEHTNKKEDEVETLNTRIEQMQNFISIKSTELKTVQEKVEELEREKAELHETLKQCDAAAKEELTKLKSGDIELQGVIVKLSADLKSSEDKINELENTRMELLQILDSEKEKSQIKEEEAKRKAQELEESKAELQLMMDGGKKTQQSEDLEHSIPLQGNSLLLEYNGLKEKHEHLRIHLDQVEQRNNKYLTQLEEGKKKYMNLERQYNSIQEVRIGESETKKKCMDLERKCNLKQEEINQLQSDKQELDIQMQQTLQEHTDIQMENKTLKAQVCSMYQDVVEKDRRIGELEVKIATFQEKSRKDSQIIMGFKAKLSQSSSIAEHRDTIKKEYDELLEQNEKLMKDNHDMLGRLEEAHSHTQTLEKEIRKLDEKHNEDAAKIFSAEELVDNHKKEAAKLKNQISVQDTTLPLLQQQVNQYMNDFNAEREACDKLRTENNRLREELNILQQRSQTMEEQLEHFGTSQMEEMMRRHGSSSQNQARLPHPSSAPNLNQSIQPGISDDEFYHRLYQGYQSTPPVPLLGRDQNYGHFNPPEDPQIPEPCPICGRQFVEMEEVQNHVGECLVAHTDPCLKCPRCDFEFPDQDTLQIHVVACLDEEFN